MSECPHADYWLRYECELCHKNVGQCLDDRRSQLAELTKERHEARGERDFFDNERVKVVEELEAEQRKLATAVEALEKISNCKSLFDGDVVDIATKALDAIREKGDVTKEPTPLPLP